MCLNAIAKLGQKLIKGIPAATIIVGALICSANADEVNPGNAISAKTVALLLSRTVDQPTDPILSAHVKKWSDERIGYYFVSSSPAPSIEQAVAGMQTILREAGVNQKLYRESDIRKARI